MAISVLVLSCDATGRSADHGTVVHSEAEVSPGCPYVREDKEVLKTLATKRKLSWKVTRPTYWKNTNK